MDEVASHVNDNRFIICLIVSASLWSEDTREVLDTVVEKGGHIVSIGQPKVTGIPATVLNVPFNTQMLLKALSSDAAAPHVPQPEDRT